jgi:hypothetical protein
MASQKKKKGSFGGFQCLHLRLIWEASLGFGSILFVNLSHFNSPSFSGNTPQMKPSQKVLDLFMSREGIDKHHGIMAKNKL